MIPDGKIGVTAVQGKPLLVVLKKLLQLQNKVSKVADKVTKNKVTKCHTDQVRLGLVRAAC